MEQKRNYLTDVLLVVLILVTAFGMTRTLSQPSDGSVALQGYQVRTVFLAAGDPLPTTMTMPIAVIQSDANLLKADANLQYEDTDVTAARPLPVGGSIEITTSADLTVTLDGEVVLVDATGQGDLPMVPFATVLEVSVELVGIDEQLAQFEWSEGTEVPLGGTYSGELLNLTVILSGTLSEADTILVFDADPSVTLADANLATASWLLAIGKYDIAAGDWFEEDSGGTGAVGTFAEPIAFHPVSSLWFTLYHEGGTTINSLAADNESVTIHVEIRRDS